MAGSFCSPFLLWFEFSVYLKVVLQEKKKQPFFREKNPLSDFNLGILCLFGCLLRVHVCKNPIYHNIAYLRLLLTLKSFVIEFFNGPFFKMFFFNWLCSLTILYMHTTMHSGYSRDPVSPISPKTFNSSLSHKSLSQFHVYGFLISYPLSVSSVWP